MNQLELFGDQVQMLARMFPGYEVTIKWVGDKQFEAGILGRECSPEDYLILPAPLESTAVELENKNSLAAVDVVDSDPERTRTSNQLIKSQLLSEE